MNHNNSSTPADTSQAATVNLLSTKEAAEFLGVSVNTLRQWRNRKLFGCRFFTPDVTYGTACYYYRERVEMLKAVYQPNVLQDMYKLARLNSEDNTPDDFQICVTRLGNAGNLRKLNSEDNTPDDFQICVTRLGNAGKLAQSTNAPACHGNLLTTKEAADIIGAEPATLRKWRERKLFGCPFFSADELHGKKWYYDRERVEQLAAVYNKGVLANLVKLSKDTANTFLRDGQFVDSSIITGRNFTVTSCLQRHGLFSAEDAAKIFSVTVKAVYQWVERGQLRWDKYDHANRYLFKKETLENFTPPGERKSGGKSMKLNGYKDVEAADLDENSVEGDEPAPVATIKAETAENPIQCIENLPAEIKTQDRFFAVDAQKVPKIRGWQKPENQRLPAQIDGLKGFDTCGHGRGDDYLLIDFDHCLDDDGNFVDDDAEDWFHSIQMRFKGYCERSISGHGLHIFGKPTPDKFAAINAGQKGTLYFGKHDTDTEKKSPVKIELFYKSAARYCLVTGNAVEDSEPVIAAGAVVDSVLQELLDDIQKQIGDDTANKKSARETRENQSNVDNRDYDEYRARIMLDCIDPAKLADSDWLAVISSCKNLGISYGVIDEWNSRDPDRYHEAENRIRWDSLNNATFDIETLHGIAKRFGYLEKDATREWHRLHPELSTTPAKSTDTVAPNSAEPNTDATPTTAEPPAPGKKIPPELQLSEGQHKVLFSGDISDLDNARRIECVYGKKIRWLTDRARWMTFGKEGLWHVSNEANSALAPAFAKLADVLRVNAANANEKKIALRLKSSKAVTGAITALKGLKSIRIKSEDLDNHPELLNCLNGVADLQTGKFYEDTDPALLITQMTAAEYHPDCRDDAVENFFATIMPDEETRAALIRWLGYCLTGEVNEEKALFIVGRGGNGKGTLTLFLTTLLNDYAASVPVTAVCEAGRFKDAGAATPELNALEKCRLAVVEEIPQGKRLDIAKFKLLTGGDKIPVRRLHEEFRNISPTHKLFLSGNHLPTLNDTRDPGFLRRLMNMKFEADFTQNPDRQLKRKLLSPNALSALLSKLVDAAKDWYRDGLLVSSAMKDAMRDYLADNDFVSEFIAEQCFRAPNASILRKEFLSRIRTEYPSECAQMSDRALADTVTKIEGISCRRGTGGGRRFFGVGWSKDIADADDRDDYHAEQADYDVSQFD